METIIPPQIDINLANNNSNCIKTVLHITSTDYVNVCNGAIINVTNGIGDYMIIAIIGACLIGMLALIIGVIYSIKNN